MSKIIEKIKFLLFCYYRGHKFGVTKYLSDGEMTVCARCGFKKKRKYQYKDYDDFQIY